MVIVYTLPLAASLCHLFEEFVWPGGFRDWYRDYRPEIAESVTNGFLVRINALMVAVGIWVAWAGPMGASYLSAWLILSTILMNNAIFHIHAVLSTRRYSPGVVTGTVLYLPLFFAGVPHIWLQGYVQTSTVIVSVGLGMLYQSWSLFNHRRRARAARSRAD